MKRRQEINKLIHTYVDVNQYEDYTDYKAFITGIDNYCKDFSISFSLFCAENYVHLSDNNWMHYTDFEDREFTTEEILEIYLNE